MLSSIHFGVAMLLLLAGPSGLVARAAGVDADADAGANVSVGGVGHVVSVGRVSGVFGPAEGAGSVVHNNAGSLEGLGIIAKRRKNRKFSAVRRRSRVVAAKHGLRRGLVSKGDRRPSDSGFPGKGRRDDPSWAPSYHFATQRGRLPWPVDSRRVSVHFGYYSYLRNVKCNSRCISIEVEPETEVRAVCDGEVESVMDMGDASAVLVRHGKYFTVYSNLPEVVVAKGDSVKEGQALGRITDAGQLDFYVYYENDNWFFDPEKWLKR